MRGTSLGGVVLRVVAWLPPAFVVWDLARPLFPLSIGLLTHRVARLRFAGFGPLQREAIAFAYQFGALILPTVAPAVFWVLTHRRFLENFAAGEAAAEKP